MLCFYEIIESAGKGHKERMYWKRAPEYWLLLLGAHGYLGGKDFMGCEDPMAYCTRKWLSDIMLRDYDSVCAMMLVVLLVIGGVEKNPGPVVEAVNIIQVLCSGCNRNLKSGTQCDVWTLVS